MATNDIIEAYIAAWNEPDAGKRKVLIDKCWADDGLYCDPQADIRGRDALDATIAGFHAQAPGARIDITSTVDQHHNQLRFLWAFRTADGNTPIEGIDVGELAPDGRLSRIVGFWGQSQPK
jgi:hypothetical protein